VLVFARFGVGKREWLDDLQVRALTPDGPRQQNSESLGSGSSDRAGGDFARQPGPLTPRFSVTERSRGACGSGSRCRLAATRSSSSLSPRIRGSYRFRRPETLRAAV
jgi:hypothetical protein